MKQIYLKDENGNEFNLMELMAEIVEDAIENSPTIKLPSPTLRDFYKDETDRVVWIDNEIDYEMLRVVKSILKYNREDINIPVEERKPIKIFIDTNGGDISIMWSIVKAIKTSKTPVWTINFSAAFSAGSHILAAGHKRFAMPGSIVLIHSGSCGYSGNQEQVEKAKKFFDKLDENIVDQLLMDTKIDKKELKKKAPFDWYLTDEEALEKGIIDEIITDFDILFGDKR